MMISMDSTGKQLADFIRLKMKEQNLSAYDVARKADNQISATTITKILSGEVSKSGTKTLSLIAKGLGVSDLEMFRAANGDDVSRPIQYQIYAERFDADDLSDTEWQMLETYFRDYVHRWKQFQSDREKLGMLIGNDAAKMSEKDKKPK